MNFLFPLRPDISVSFTNLPRDLMMEEVRRIVTFLESIPLSPPEVVK